MCRLVRAYVAGALFGQTKLPYLRDLYSEIGRFLEGSGIHPYLPHEEFDPETHATAEPLNVFHVDHENLLQADVLIAYLGTPSLGVGAEVAAMVAADKPVIGFHEADAKVSRYILGLLEKHAKSTTLVFVTLDDLFPSLESQLLKLPIQAPDFKELSGRSSPAS